MGIEYKVFVCSLSLVQDFQLGVRENVVLSPGMGDGLWKSVEFCWTVSISGEGQEGEVGTTGPQKAGTQGAHLFAMSPLRNTALK